MSNEQKVTRKLRAILSADVKGYSLLMADDETFIVFQSGSWEPAIYIGLSFPEKGF